MWGEVTPMFRNMIFPNLLSEVLYYVGFFGLLLGAGVFVVHILRRDSLYEALIAWPARLLIYAIAYLAFPPAAVVVAAIMLRKRDRQKRKFAVGSLYVGALWGCNIAAFMMGAGMK
jgi:hypothetical protein